MSSALSVMNSPADDAPGSKTTLSLFPDRRWYPRDFVATQRRFKNTEVWCCGYYDPKYFNEEGAKAAVQEHTGYDIHWVLMKPGETVPKRLIYVEFWIPSLELFNRQQRLSISEWRHAIKMVREHRESLQLSEVELAVEDLCRRKDQAHSHILSSLSQYPKDQVNKAISRLHSHCVIIMGQRRKYSHFSRWSRINPPKAFIPVALILNRPTTAATIKLYGVYTIPYVMRQMIADGYITSKRSYRRRGCTVLYTFVGWEGKKKRGGK